MRWGKLEVDMIHVQREGDRGRGKELLRNFWRGVDGWIPSTMHTAGTPYHLSVGAAFDICNMYVYCEAQNKKIDELKTVETACTWRSHARVV